MTYSKFSNQEIVNAYRATGSVWKAGRKLGLAGQTVHGRLRAIDYPIRSRWTDEEVSRLGEMVGDHTIGQIASELGRSYTAVASRISNMGIGTRYGNGSRKIPRGAGFDKVSVTRHIKILKASEIPITRYAKQNGMKVDVLIRAIEKYDPEWWREYRNGISNLPEARCPHCGEDFYPSNTRQVFCSRLCSSRYRVDQDYFGGKRCDTIGLNEGTCQCCGGRPKSGLSSHHVLGKENDQDNDYLVALCRGCHNLVTLLGNRNFGPREWEALIAFAHLRRYGSKMNDVDTLHITVDIDVYESEES